MDACKLFSLKGRFAFITGGSRGLGFAMGCALASAGAEIAFCARSKASVENGIAAYKAKGIASDGYVCDITDEERVKELFTYIENNSKHVDILLNNAGVINRVPMTEMEASDFRRILDTDLTGAFITAKAAIPYMIEKGGGKIINVCGIMSEVGRETASAYASAKGGLKMLTRNIAAEYGACNIQCNAVAPGYIATDMNAPLRKKLEDGSQNPFDRFICAQTPAGRWGKPEDLAGPVLFLASDASNFVNGQIIYIDGGFLSYMGKSC